MKKFPVNKSLWHYPRDTLTKKLVQSFCLGLVNSFTLFAQRRMGKTEFLLHDLKPSLEDNGYKVIYFSFYDASSNKVESFVNTIKSEIKREFYTAIKLKEISFSWCKFSFNDEAIDTKTMSLSNMLSALSYQTINSGQNGVVLLLDEIQELLSVSNSHDFIAGLRTALDVNQEDVKVIFTGSSQNGLKKMFSDMKAPFFHFGSNLELDKFDKSFTDFLADIFYARTKIELDKTNLYDVFLKLDRVTAHIRRVIDLTLLEDIKLDQALITYMQEIYNPELIEEEWLSFLDVEKCIYLWVMAKNYTFYTSEFRSFATSKFPSLKLTNSKIQYALSKLLDKNQIRALNTGEYECCNLMLNKWLLEFNN